MEYEKNTHMTEETDYLTKLGFDRLHADLYERFTQLHFTLSLVFFMCAILLALSCFRHMFHYERLPN